MKLSDMEKKVVARYILKPLLGTMQKNPTTVTKKREWLSYPVK
jgi:hypothetical protein